MRIQYLGLAIAGCLAFGIVTAADSTPFSDVRGTITDSRGVPVPGVHVDLRPENGQNNGDWLSVDTNDKGEFQFPPVEPGHWAISYDKRGYEEKGIIDINVRSRRHLVLTVNLDRRPSWFGAQTALFFAHMLGEEHESIARIDRLRDRALRALRTGNKKEFYYYRALIARISRSAPDLYGSPAYAGDVLGWSLPDQFVPGYAYTRDDGTVAADPDPSIVLQLVRDRYSFDAGGGAGGGSD